MDRLIKIPPGSLVYLRRGPRQGPPTGVVTGVVRTARRREQVSTARPGRSPRSRGRAPDVTGGDRD